MGLAWEEAHEREPGLDLWDSDGKHPNLAGSYLAACVFYAMLSGRNPSGSEFTGGLEPAEARLLQRVASDVVLGAHATQTDQISAGAPRIPATS